MVSKQNTNQRRAKNRREDRIVARYIGRLEEGFMAEGQPNLEKISADLERVDSLLESAKGVERLELLQNREDLERVALGSEARDDRALEAQFIAVARSYGERKGISYSTWREFGVSKRVLETAGIPRTRRANGAVSRSSRSVKNSQRS